MRRIESKREQWPDRAAARRIAIELSEEEARTGLLRRRPGLSARYHRARLIRDVEATAKDGKNLRRVPYVFVSATPGSNP